MADINTQMNTMSTSIDLSMYKVLTPDMENALNDFKNSGIDTIDFATINSTVSNIKTKQRQ